MSDHSNTIPVMPPEYSGRLELTWTNKHRRLLAHEDGTYEWVDPGDHRVAEIRLLKEAGVVAADEEAEETAGENLLIRGDALAALTSLVKLPEYAAKYRGKIKLVYIDPPFNTGGAFTQYDDNLEHSVWLTMIRDRLAQIRDLLADDGSIWLHLDDVEQHRARVVLDELFGIDNFVGTVIWEKTDSPRMDARSFSTSHDNIHVYRRSPAWEPNRHEQDPDEAAYPHVDGNGQRYSRRELRKWGKNSLRADRPKLWYPIEGPDRIEVWPIRPDGREGRWRWSREKYEAEIDRIEWVEVRGGLEPYIKTYMHEGKRPIPPRTIWPVSRIGGNPLARREQKMLFPGVEPFETPKPEVLLAEVISVSSNPGDLVLDCFVGSGTTAAVAHKMGRRWVGVEWSEDTLATFTIPRLTKVVNGEDPGGITETVGWEGGGGFRILDVAPSMFSEEDGVVYLADWAADDELAEPVAAQLGFKYQPDPPFCGRKGRTQLAVIDGMLTPEVADLLADRLADGETLSVAATSIHPDAEARLGERVKGYALRKVPESILAEYASTYRRRRQKELGIRSTATGDND